MTGMKWTSKALEDAFNLWVQASRRCAEDAATYRTLLAKEAANARPPASESNMPVKARP